MNRKQKINLASLIVSRLNVHLLRRIFLEEVPNGEQLYLEFWAAEQKGGGEQYLRELASYFPAERRNELAEYYKVQGILAMKMVHRGEKVFTAFPSRIPEYLKAAGRGVLAELDFVKAALEESDEVHRNTILATYADEIKLYHPFADPIIRLYPTWGQDEALSEYVKAATALRSLPQDPTDCDETDLAYLILRQITPDENGQWLNLPDSQAHRQCMQLMQKEVTFLLNLDSDVTEAQKRQMTINNQALLQYLASVDEPANAAFAALIYETISPANRLTPEFLHGLWTLGVQYARLEELTEADHEAIRRMFRYFIATWEGQGEHLLIQMMGPSAKPMIIKAWMVLAKSSMALWEWEEAVDCYKKIAALRAENGDTAKATKALFDAVDCLQTVFLKKEALALSHQLLKPEGEGLAALGLPAGFELDAEGREAIEVNMVNLLDGVNLSDKTIKFYTSLLQTNAAKSLYRLQVGMEMDTVTSEDLQLAGDALSDFYGAQHGTGGNAAYNRAVDTLLHLLNDNRGPNYFEDRLREVSQFENEFPDELKLLHQLNLAKLAYLQDDPACLDAFAGLIPQMGQYPDPFDEPRKSQWLTSGVRAWHLALPDQPERIGELEEIALQAIDVMLKGYLVRYRDRSALASLMNESEELIKALLLNEAFVQNDLECSQRLLRMVWNVLMLRKEFLNRYMGKAGLEIVHESRYIGQVAALRQELYHYLANPSQTQADSLWEKVWDFRDGESPYWQKRTELNKWEDPLEPSLAFHFFTKTDEGRMLLMLSFQPNGHAVPEERFLYATREVPDTLEAYLDTDTPVDGASIGDAHRYIAGFIGEENQYASAKQLFGPDWEAPFNRLFADFLMGGEEFFRLSRWQHNLLEERPAQPTPRLNLYCDHFLQLLPIERLYIEPTTSLGLNCNFAMVLRQAHRPYPIDFGYKVVIVSDVPSQLGTPALPFAVEEANAIEQLLSNNGTRTNHLQGPLATRANLDAALAEYPAIVHFATHGLADPGLPPETSSLLLSAEGNDAASCLLTYQDILLMDWSSVKLVVLSACNSSVGKVRKGSPMQGLAYAFLSKGVQYVVASRSPVSDRSSKIIMTKFYEYLQSTDVVEAMRLTRTWFHENPGPVSENDMMAWGVWT